MAGYYDAQGIWIHDENDTYPTTAGVLNRGQRSVSDAIKPLLLLKVDATAARDAARTARDAAIGSKNLAANSAAQAAATAAAVGEALTRLEQVGGIIYEDPADPGTYLVTAGGPLTEDPADPGTYQIGA